MSAVIRMSCVAMLCDKPVELNKAQQYYLWQHLQEASWIPSQTEWRWLGPVLLRWAQARDAAIAEILTRHCTGMPFLATQSGQ